MAPGKVAPKRRFLGFTLIELLTVVVVIGVLAGISLVQYGNSKEKSYRAAMLNDVHNYAVSSATHMTDGSAYLRPEALPGYRYTVNDSTMGFSSDGSSWVLLVANKNTRTVCGAQMTTGGSVVPSCGTPTSGGIIPSTTEPTAGETVVYDVTGYLSQVAVASPGVQTGPQSLLSPGTLLASTNVGNAVLIGWDFGDGQTLSGPPATTAVVTHTYAQAGSYTVKVGIMGASGQVFSASMNQTTTPNGAGGSGFQSSGNRLPTAAFTVTSNPVTAGVATGFDASGSTDTDGSIASYAWNFGDGQTGTGATASHTYTAAGSYTVTLVVTDNQGGTGVVQQSVSATSGSGTSNVPPVASFTGATSLTTGQSATYTSTSTDASGIASYAWSVSGVTASPATSTTSTFTPTFSTTGTAVVSLTVTNTNGISASTTQNVTVAAPSTTAPTVTFSADKVAPETSETVTFSMLASSNNPGGTFNVYNYDFGDGIVSNVSDHTVTHAYTPGTWVASVTATDNYGASTTKTVTITVTSANVVVAMTGGPGVDTTYKGRTNSFSVTGNTFHGSISSYTWAWGDGAANSTTAAPTHTFTATGTPTVTLTATDSYGSTATASLGITVTAGAAPSASFTVTPVSDTLTTAQSLTVDASASHSNNTGGSIASYSWDFGDGHTATGATPTSYQYAAAGSYAVTLTVTDELGLTAASTTTVTVNSVSAGAVPPAGQDLWFRADQGVSGPNWTDVSDNGAAENGGVHPVLTRYSGTTALGTASGTSNGHTNPAIVSPLLKFTSSLSWLASTTGTVVVVTTPVNPTAGAYLMYTGSPSSGSGFYLYASSPSREVGAGNSQGTSFLDAAGNAVSQSIANTWVYTNDGSTATATINGVTVTRTSSFFHPLTAGSTWTVGGNANGGSPSFPGNIYEIIVYRRVLSGAEMSALNSYLTSRY